MKEAHEILFENTQRKTAGHLMHLVIKATNKYDPDVPLLSFLSELGELSDDGREQILSLAKVGYQNLMDAQPQDNCEWDHGCYKD